MGPIPATLQARSALKIPPLWSESEMKLVGFFLKESSLCTFVHPSSRIMHGAHAVATAAAIAGPRAVLV